EETAFHPSGMPRHEHQPKSIDARYTFTGKERDRESGLHYFEARYLSAALGRFAIPDPKYANLDGLAASELGSLLSEPQQLNLYAYAFNNPLRYNDPSGLDGNDKVSAGVDSAGIVASSVDEAALWNYRFRPSATSSGAPTGLKVVGKTAAVISITWKTAEFLNKRDAASGGQLANEVAKTAVGAICPPVGLIWSVLDLTGYGPSAYLAALDATTQAHRASAKAYRQTAETYRGMTKMLNEATPRIAAQQQHAAERLKVLNRETAKWHEKSRKALKGETRSLEQLNAAIKAQERANARTAAQLRRELARLR
ncbi:MAG TPA: RHS repeat-associated core domain-containing protein, partial [Candidatus Saccharimonadales bacterium]|nr:RHS repeat-associated core domain-containing protein [Candidatus Saccharimonadales bacterium]